MTTIFAQMIGVNLPVMSNSHSQQINQSSKQSEIFNVTKMAIAISKSTTKRLLKLILKYYHLKRFEG